MRDDPRLKKLKALALTAATPVERQAALAAIDRVVRSDRPVTLFSKDGPLENRRRAIARMKQERRGGGA